MNVFSLKARIERNGERQGIDGPLLRIMNRRNDFPGVRDPGGSHVAIFIEHHLARHVPGGHHHRKPQRIRVVTVAHGIRVLNLDDDFFVRTHIGYPGGKEIVPGAGDQTRPLALLLGPGNVFLASSFSCICPSTKRSPIFIRKRSTAACSGNGKI